VLLVDNRQGVKEHKEENAEAEGNSHLVGQGIQEGEGEE